MASSPDPAAAGVRVHRPSPDRNSRPRVCDNCIRQKVKCDLGKPTCSRCRDRGFPCTYSSHRRKPGPTPGSRRAHAAPPGLPTVYRKRPRVVHDPPSGFNVDFPSPESPVLSTTTSSTLVTLDLATGPAAQPPLKLFNIEPEEEDYLLGWYIETIHHAIPLFLCVRAPGGGGTTSREAFAGCSRELIQALVAIAAKLSGFVLSSVTQSELDTHIDRMLSAASLQEDIASDNPTLDQFRKSCLLVFYEYHQCPGQQAWMRAGKLVRWAYWTGLDGIENLHQVSPQWKDLTEDELEEWRLVWWCIYAIDSYANLATGMPYQVDEQLINTALPRGPQPPDRNRHFLPFQEDGLLDLVHNILSDSPPQTAAWEIQIVSITILRDIGRATRLRALGGAWEGCIALTAKAERRLSTLRLALPGNFFNPRRNVFTNESASDHHFRLVTIHHMLTAQLLALFSYCGHLPEGEEWLQNWQQVLEICQDVAALAEQWNSSFCLRVDPALCIIAFVSLVFLRLHLRFADSSGGAPSANNSLHANIEHCESVLLLFLEQFAKSWTQPRLLILSFKSFRESLSSPIGYPQVRAVLLHFQSPLHPRWLQFLKSADEILKNCS